MTRRARFILLGIQALAIAIVPLIVSADTASPYLPNPIHCDTILCLLMGGMRWILAGLAVFSTFMFMYGGFVFLTSGGNAERIKKGKDTLLWASVGIVTVLGSWVLIQYVIQTVTRASK